MSFSGGKDSTVLLDLVRKIYPDVPAVFSDTGLEFPELREFVKTFDNVTWVKPKMTFSEVIKKYGYPIISKNVAEKIYYAQRGTEHGRKAMRGEDKDGNPSLWRKQLIKYAPLVDTDIPISHYCCQIMKKTPAKNYEHETGRKAFIGTMTCESALRKQTWINNGCNAFASSRPISQPMAFWIEQDVLRYIKEHNLPYAPVYGNLVEDDDGKLHFTQYNRTGCVFCGFGCHLEKEPNRFQTLAKTHPQLYNYCMRGGKYEDGKWIPDKGLGMAKVLDCINVKWWNDETTRDKYREEYLSKQKE